MSHFAEIKDCKVVRVIVAEQEFINTLQNPKDWIRTSYNTYHGTHKLGGTPLRKNFAGIGFTYDKNRDAFIPPKRYNSFIFDEEKCAYIPPIPKPNDGKEYNWYEKTLSWIEVNN